AAAALNGPQDCVDEIRSIYRRRRDCLVDAITRAGWPIPSPPATMFAWAPIPEMFAHLGSLEFSKLRAIFGGSSPTPPRHCTTSFPLPPRRIGRSDFFHE